MADLIAADATDYYRQLLALRPPGPAWPVDDPILRGLAAECARAHTRLVSLLDEADPRSTREMLSAWERQAGLPDACSAGIATTVQERRAAVVDAITARGGASVAYLQAIAIRLGYAVAIKEFRPFICGKSRCGDVLGGPHRNRHYLRITVLGPRLTDFRAGVSRCGERLGKFTRAEDLECRLRRVAPAHVVLIFAYKGV
ncbi:YmfQ family protein [Magnetospirillum molischianum]|uniref:Putative Tail protein n=1 Tax=Magnetospirillum molischianum DSM 120 TaxID=1150626 RepID=H8FV06_MAGML|nr:putative phage tail protein [Magnetospirillum molischianum]CCG42194.1 putative Tail protein [Magnetospirillum molischianum DSM 120]